MIDKIEIKSIPVTSLNSIKGANSGYNGEKIIGPMVQSEVVDLDIDVDFTRMLPIINFSTNPPTVTVKDINGKYHSYQGMCQGEGLGIFDENGNKVSGIYDETMVLIEKWFPEWSDTQIDEYLVELNGYSQRSGCGGYTALTILNGYLGLDIFKSEFFTDVMINSLGKENWSEMVDKCGPLNIEAIGKIISDYGVNCEYLADYNVGDLQKGEYLGDQLISHLNDGRPAVIMVQALDGENWDLSKTQNTFVGDAASHYEQLLAEAGDANGKDNTWTNGKHWITLVNMDENGMVTVIDSRNLGSNYNQVRQVPYEELIKYVVSNDDRGENESYFWQSGSNKPGILLIDTGVKPSI